MLRQRPRGKRRGRTCPPIFRDANFEKAKHEKKSEAYKYAHDYPRHYVEQQYLPDEMKDRVFYRPSMQGYEQKVHEYRRFIGKEKEAREIRREPVDFAGKYFNIKKE